MKARCNYEYCYFKDDKFKSIYYTGDNVNEIKDFVKSVSPKSEVTRVGKFPNVKESSLAIDFYRDVAVDGFTKVADSFLIILPKGNHLVFRHGNLKVVSKYRFNQGYKVVKEE